MLDRAKHLSWSADIFRQTLTRLGYCSKRQDGTWWEVSFCDALYYQPRDAGLLEVDVHRLPRKVKAADLAAAGVLHELSTAIGGLTVEVRNRRGLVYVIRYTEPERAAEVELPRRVDLDLADRPGGAYAVPVGVGAAGPRWASLLDLLNVLVGGEPGAGKSMLLNTWLAALTTVHGPDKLRLTLVDPKRVELAGWRHLPHLQGPIATTPEGADAALDLLLDDLDRRARVMQEIGARSLAGYNELATSTSSGQATDPLPLHLVIIDELTDLTLSAGGARSELFKKLIRVASTGRALGVLFVVATQSPRSEIVNGNLKAAMNTRLAFRCASRTDSRVILDRPDAGDIGKRNPGRMVAMLGDGLEALQGYYVSDETLVGLQGDHGGDGGEVLTDAERELVIHAVGAYAGAFVVNKLAEDLEGWSNYRVAKLAKQWERRGWLTEPADAVSPRRVTPVLARLAGLTGTV